MTLIGEAHAQAAEAISAGSKAGEVFLDRGVLGAACVFLLIAVGVLFVLLIKAYASKVALLERVVTATEQSKVSNDDNTEATKGLAAAVAGLTAAVQTLAREAEGEAREARHGIAQLAQIVTSNADMLRAAREQMASNGEVLRDLRGHLGRGRE